MPIVQVVPVLVGSAPGIITLMQSAGAVYVLPPQLMTWLPLASLANVATVLPEPMARDARSRGAAVLTLRPSLSRTLRLVHPAAGMSPAAVAFVALAGQPRRRPKPLAV